VRRIATGKSSKGIKRLVAVVVKDTFSTLNRLDVFLLEWLPLPSPHPESVTWHQAVRPPAGSVSIIDWHLSWGAPQINHVLTTSHLLLFRELQGKDVDDGTWLLSTIGHFLKS
jgi:hypothetical protein